MAKNPQQAAGPQTTQTAEPDPARAAEADRIAAEEAARAVADQLTADHLAAQQAAAAATSQTPVSAQLEPFATTRTRRPETVVEERVAIRTEAVAPGHSLDPLAPLFPAKARVLAGGQVVQARPAEAIAGETREVLLLSRALHDGVLYEAGSSAEVTRAQFDALRIAGAVGDVLWAELA